MLSYTSFLKLQALWKFHSTKEVYLCAVFMELILRHTWGQIRYLVVDFVFGYRDAEFFFDMMQDIYKLEDIYQMRIETGEIES